MVTDNEKALFKWINERFVKAFATYHLLEDDDYVLVGLSGGKDSLCLLELLAKRARINHPRFRVAAVHVRMENIAYQTSTDYLERFCQELDVPLHIVTTRFDDQPQDDGQKSHSPKPACFLCSWNRRKQMFNLAQQLGCNKIALGHHQDDIICTALMNLVYQGRFGTMPALLKMRKMALSIIRPLCLVDENHILSYAKHRGYEPQVKLCPYEKATNRQTMTALFQQLQQMNPEVRYSIWNALERDGKLVEES